MIIKLIQQSLRYTSLFLFITCVVAQTQWRVLVDISGSMKKNDPLNYRKEALAILKNIAPADLDVGVYIFAMQADTLIEPQPVDSKWLELWNQNKEKIDYRGQWTNIEGALDKVIPYWTNNGSKHIILITDGVVDISDDPEKNTASRWKIFHEHLDELQKNDIHVHTLSLGKSSDQQLLQILSHATDGLSRTVTSSDQIYDFLIDLTKVGTNYQQLPLSEHEFKVDANLEEILILSPSKLPPMVSDPNGKRVDIQFERAHNTFIAKVSKPLAGQWQIQGEFDKKPSILIESDLKLVWKQSPQIVLFGQPFKVETAIQGWPEHIKGKGHCHYSVPSKWQVTEITSGDGHQCQALFSPHLSDQTGDIDISVTYKHALFERQLEKTIQVIPYAAKISKLFDSSLRSWIVQLEPEIVFWQLDDLKIGTKWANKTDHNCQMGRNKVYRCRVANHRDLDTAIQFTIEGSNRKGIPSYWQSAPLSLTRVSQSLTNDTYFTDRYDVQPAPASQNKAHQPMVDKAQESQRIIKQENKNQEDKRKILKDEKIPSEEGFVEKKKKDQKEIKDSLVIVEKEQINDNDLPERTTFSEQKELPQESSNELSEQDLKETSLEQGVEPKQDEPAEATKIISLDGSNDNNNLMSFAIQQVIFLMLLGATSYALVRLSRRMKEQSIKKIDEL